MAIAMTSGITAAAPEVSPYHPWKGLKIAYLGDSISDARHSPSTKKYWQWLAEWLDTTPYVYAKSGRQWTDIKRQADLLDTEHGSDFDAIVIFMGTNDYIHDVAMGQWYTETSEDVDFALGAPKRSSTLRKRVLDMDTDTYKGRINNALAMLKSRYPDKQIVILTPIHRAGFFHSDTNWQPEESYANRLGLYLDDYVTAVKEASAIWSVPVIDIHSLSGLYPLDDAYAGYYTDADTDRLHPNTAGHYRIAMTLLYQLSTLPGHIK